LTKLTYCHEFGGLLFFGTHCIYYVALFVNFDPSVAVDNTLLQISQMIASLRSVIQSKISYSTQQVTQLDTEKDKGNSLSVDMITAVS